MGKIEKLAKEEVAQLTPYISARDLYKSAEAFMDANENSFGGSVGPVEGVQLNRYPDPDQNELRDELAKYAGVERGNVLVGNGSDEIISLCVRAFVDKGDNAITLEPGYSMYSVCAKAEGGEVREVLLDSDFQPDLEAIAAASDGRTKMVFVVSPNSPVGVPAEKKKIERLAKETNAIVFVDEAYIEFGGESCAGFVDRYENLVVSRTFSKAWGLAGLRVGYMVANERVIALIRRLKQPYNVNALSAALAVKALRGGIARMGENLAKMRKEREWLADNLAKLGFEVFPSVCNFLLVRPPLGAKTAIEMQKEIASNGLIIRDRSNLPMIPNTFRITIGTPEQNRKLVGYTEALIRKGGEYDCVLFDMDGVLVDVRDSYRKAIEETAGWCLKKQGGMAVSQKEVSAIKSIVGFNNDWNAAYAIVKAGGRLEEIARAKPLSSEEKKSELYAELKGRFQSAYLDGLMQKEPALASKEVFEKLLAIGKKIGIVTGRPRCEAEFALRNNGWEGFFKKEGVVSLDDCDEEKPSPKPLLLAAQRLGAARPVYVGDNASDAAACRAAKMPCVIVGFAVKGDWNVEKTDDIAGGFA